VLFTNLPVVLCLCLLRGAGVVSFASLVLMLLHNDVNDEVLLVLTMMMTMMRIRMMMMTMVRILACTVSRRAHLQHQALVLNAAVGALQYGQEYLWKNNTNFVLEVVVEVRNDAQKQLQGEVKDLSTAEATSSSTASPPQQPAPQPPTPQPPQKKRQIDNKKNKTTAAAAAQQQ